MKIHSCYIYFLSHRFLQSTFIVILLSIVGCTRMQHSNMKRGEKTTTSSRRLVVEQSNDLRGIIKKTNSCLEQIEDKNFKSAFKKLDTNHQAFILNVLSKGDPVNNLQKFYDTNPSCTYHLQEVNKTTPVWYAVSKNNTEIVKFLVERGANFNTPSHRYGDSSVPQSSSYAENLQPRYIHNTTPLMAAIRSNHMDILTFLLQQEGINVNYMDDEHELSTLEYAVCFGSVSAVNSLLNHKDIIIDVKNGNDHSIIVLAIHNKNYEMLELILKKISTDKKLCDEMINCEFKKTPSKKMLECMRTVKDPSTFLVKQPKVEKPKIVLSPLMLAIDLHLSDIVALLLHYGANPNMRNAESYGEPLRHAIRIANVCIVNLLIEYKADVTAMDLNGYNALYYALHAILIYEKYPIEIVKKIFNLSNDSMWSSALLSDFLQSLFIRHAQSDDSDEKQMITHAICLIVKHQQAQAKDQIKYSIKYEIEKPINFISDSIFDTLLTDHICMNASFDVDEFLMIVIKNYNPNNVYENSTITATTVFATFLLNSIIFDDKDSFILDKKQINDITPYGRPLFSYFAEYGYTTLVEKLLSYGIRADTSCKSNSRTPLSYAAANGHHKVVSQLLEKGADINAVSKGKSILYYALSKLDEKSLEEGLDRNTIGHHTTLNLLLQHKKIQPSVASLPIEAYLKLFKFVCHRIKKSPDQAADLLSVMAIHERLISGNEENKKKILQAIRSAQTECKCSPKTANLTALLTDCLSQSYNKKTPLSVAVKRGNKDMVKGLLELNVPICGSKNTAFNLLSVAIEQGDQEIFQWLLAKATLADINQLVDKGKPPLYYAIDKGNIAMVKALLARGASLTQRYGKKKLTPLLYALSITRCSSDLIDSFMNNPSDLAAVDASGHGVLWYAFHKDHIDAAKLLIAQLQSSNNVLPDMYDVLAYAQSTHRKEFHELLEPYVLAVLDIEVACLAEWTTIVNNPNSSGEQIGKNKRNKKDLIFTKHATDRIKERGVSDETITTVFNNRKSNITGVFSISINVPLSTKPLCVIVHETDKKIIVITTYWKEKECKKEVEAGLTFGI